jgi:hypothetical protein
VAVTANIGTVALRGEDGPGGLPDLPVAHYRNGAESCAWPESLTLPRRTDAPSEKATRRASVQHFVGMRLDEAAIRRDIACALEAAIRLIGRSATFGCASGDSPS